MDSETPQCELDYAYSLQAVKTMGSVVSQQGNACNSHCFNWCAIQIQGA
ncbi:MAG: hypothetical protein MGG11_14650 [Trichodesmium sp. MAG_R03]|nr:hypothetical protein [Trichodesmium sp. MAG_R03]